MDRADEFGVSEEVIPQLRTQWRYNPPKLLVLLELNDLNGILYPRVINNNFTC